MGEFPWRLRVWFVGFDVDMVFYVKKVLGALTPLMG